MSEKIVETIAGLGAAPLFSLAILGAAALAFMIFQVVVSRGAAGKGKR